MSVEQCCGVLIIHRRVLLKKLECLNKQQSDKIACLEDEEPTTVASTYRIAGKFGGDLNLALW